MNEIILVIDDDPLNIKLISTYLSNYGYKVIGAENGHDGIELAVNSGPDLILLDILMPKLNGFETCIILKENTKTEKIPIIFLTALAESVSIKKAFEIGGVDYVTKPIEFNGLLARIATHLKLKNMNRALEHEVQEKTIELQSANVELIKLLSEKELFLKELNHRTKNNLAVIVSMISLHAEEIKDQKLSNILTEISNKISSMNLIHRRLYQSDNFQTVDMKEYINELVGLIKSSFSFSKEGISIVTNLKDIYLSIDSAIACGMIINEMLTNSFKYAFPQKLEGQIKINLEQNSHNEISMKIEDNGIGISDINKMYESETLGIRTIRGIGEHQLDGSVKFAGEHGFSCKIEFKDNIQPIF
jgi:two-component sensor histidine kinase